MLDASLLAGTSLLVAVVDPDEEAEDVSLLVAVADSEDEEDDEVSLLVIVAI